MRTRSVDRRGKALAFLALVGSGGALVLSTLAGSHPPELEPDAAPEHDGWIDCRLTPVEREVPAPDVPPSVNGRHEAIGEKTDCEPVPGPALVIQGELFIHEEPRELTPERGVLRWEAKDPIEGVTRECVTRVDRGRFKLEVESGTMLTPLDFTSVTGWMAQCTSGPIAAAPGVGPRVVALWAHGVRLHVLDAVTRAPLEEVELRLTSPWDDDGLLAASGACLGCPDPIREITLDRENVLSPTASLGGASPIHLPAVLGVQAVWVGAPDHAWRRVAFQGTEGELTVLLRPSAELVVDLICAVDPPLPRRPVLRLVEAGKGGQVLAELPVAATADLQSFHFAGLAPGEIEVALELVGPRRVDSQVVSQSVSLSPAAIHHVRLASDECGPTVVRGSLALTLVFPDDSFPAELVDTLILHPLEGSELAELAPTHRLPNEIELLAERAGRRATFDRLSAGRYAVEVHPLGARHELIVERAATTEVEIALAPPTRASLTVVDQRSGRVLDSSTVRIRPAESSSLQSWRDVAFDPRRRRWQVSGSAGQVQLSVSCPSFEPYVGRHELEADEQELVVRLVRAGGAELVLTARQASGTEVPLSPRIWYETEVRRVGEDEPVAVARRLAERFATSAPDGSSATFVVERAGTYHLRLPPIDGYAPIELEVEVAAGESRACDVLLVPADE